MYRKLQDQDPRDRGLQAAPEVECFCTCKGEADRPRRAAAEFDQNSMYQADYYVKNGES